MRKERRILVLEQMWKELLDLSWEKQSSEGTKTEKWKGKDGDNLIDVCSYFYEQ